MERGLPLATILSKKDKSNEKYHKKYCNPLNVDVASKSQPNISILTKSKVKIFTKPYIDQDSTL